MQHDLRPTGNRAFFLEQIDGTARSARIVVPLVMRLVRDVRSVVDVGCGTGVWLASFKEAGVPRVLGLDYDWAAEQGQLEIEPDEFRAANLERDIELAESFDLCLCLEVAQHLTHRAAAVIVQNICSLSDVVLFSAAIPGQGGCHHVNERWPSYWADLFGSAGYEVLDPIRGRIWNDARVEWRYRQNAVLFANKAGLPRLAFSSATTVETRPLDFVHPACFEQYRRLSEQDGSLAQLLERRNADLELDSQASGRDETLAQKISLLEGRNVKLERDLQEIVNSRSWKLTGPLRRVIGKHDNLRRKLRALIRWLSVSAKFLKQLGSNRSL